MDAWPMVQALWLFLPAYVANMSPVLSAKLAPGWNAPIDGGRHHKDGRRMLGDGKTWRGLAGGALLGGLAALGMSYLAAPMGGAGWLPGWDFGRQGYAGGDIGAAPGVCEGTQCQFVIHTTGPLLVFLFGAVVGLMALLGDAAESYLKRRTGRDRGAAWFPFDQLDFVVFGLLGMLLASPLLPAGWVIEALFGHWLILTTLIVGTPALHLLVNRIGYWLKLKDVPW